MWLCACVHHELQPRLQNVPVQSGDRENVVCGQRWKFPDQTNNMIVTGLEFKPAILTYGRDDNPVHSTEDPVRLSDSCNSRPIISCWSFVQTCYRKKGASVVIRKWRVVINEDDSEAINFTIIIFIVFNIFSKPFKSQI